MSLALAAGSALGHDGGCSRHINGCVHVHHAGTNVSCSQPGASCTTNSGAAGTCKELTGGGVIHWRSCKCVKSNSGTGDYQTAAGWHLVAVEPPEIVPGGVNVFVFADTSAADAMTFAYGDGTVIDSLATAGASGQLMIQWDVVPPPLTGQVIDFNLSFPSYDLFGTPTGQNTWTLAPGPPAGVLFDLHHDANYIMSATALDIVSTNDIFPPRPAWLSFALREPERGQWTALLTEIEEITGASPVENESWGTIKGLYR